VLSVRNRCRLSHLRWGESGGQCLSWTPTVLVRGEKQPVGTRHDYRYDEAGKLQSQVRGACSVVHFKYDQGRRETEILDDEGAVWRLETRTIR
jgi:YD repeat-containing protein